jgi:hypothetical protein
MSQVNAEIRARIESFAADLTALVQKAALDAVVNALSASGAAPAAKRAAAPAKKAAPAPAKPAAKSAARPKGAKRPPGEIAKTTQRLADYIKSNPGQGIEAIGKALATPTKDLTLPIKKLLGDKKIVAKGEKRATKYYPG